MKILNQKINLTVMLAHNMNVIRKKEQVFIGNTVSGSQHSQQNI